MVKAKEEATEAHVSLRDSVLPCRLGARRAHNKTRTGCGTCKRRRIKCDEGRPTCKNCARCSLACDFDLSRPPPPSSSTGIKRKRGRPMKEWALSLPHEENVQPTYSLAEPTAALPHLNVDDLQLYHHYLTSASLALGDDVLWGQKVPFLAFEHHYVLHLALSISALHRCRKNPVDEAKLVPLAEAHHDAALRQVTEQLPQINKANCSALYVATVLIFDYNLARSHSKTHLGPNAERAPFTWLSLFRGVRFTIETMGLAAIFSGCLGAVSSTHQAHVAPSQLEAGHIAWEEPLAKLAELILPVQKPDLRGLYQALVDCYRDVYGTAQEPNHYPNGNIRAVLRWLWVVEDDFIHQARQKEPHALVFPLAYPYISSPTLSGSRHLWNTPVTYVNIEPAKFGRT